MRHAYLLADGELDRMFGFKFEQAQVLIPTGISPQEYHIVDTIRWRYKYEPTVRDVLVVENNEDRGLVGKVNVHTKKRLYANDVSPRMNSNLRLSGDYFDELKNYLIEESDSDRIVIAHSRISPAVKKDMEKLVGELYLRAEIFPETTP
ncbi:hypothetical protein HYV88_01185 [Candidatus Woesearchaeota archaeon]|nr:hypothetical protein [Candidatus Woesearchaeota archaeon]